MSDDNDIRAAIGSLVHSQRSIHEKLDDLTAAHATFVKLRELVDFMEELVAKLPDAIEQLSNDPMLGMFATFLDPIKTALVEGTAALNRRTEAPTIENTKSL